MSWAAVASVAGSVIVGSMQADAAGNAADAQAGATAGSIGEQRRQYDQTRADQAPYRQAGSAALARLNKLLGLDAGGSGGEGTPEFQNIYDRLYNQADQAHSAGYGMPLSASSNRAAAEANLKAQARAEYDKQAAGRPPAAADPEFGSLLRPFSAADLEADPVYKSGLDFGLSEGRNAINQRAVQAGGYDSGATLKALTRYGNDYGSTKANESFNRRNVEQGNVFNRLSGITGTGQTATNQTAAAGTSMANNVSSSLTDAGNARAAGIVGGANAWGGALQGANNAYQGYQSNKRLEALLRGNGGYGGYGNYADPDAWDDSF